MHFTVQLLLLWCLILSVSSLENGLARTPPRGWRSWNLFGLKISQQLFVKEIFPAMVNKSRGKSLLELGYSDV